MIFQCNNSVQHSYIHFSVPSFTSAPTSTEREPETYIGLIYESQQGVDRSTIGEVHLWNVCWGHHKPTPRPDQMSSYQRKAICDFFHSKDPFLPYSTLSNHWVRNPAKSSRGLWVGTLSSTV